MKGRVILMDLRPNGRRAILLINGRIDGIEIDILSEDALPRTGDIWNARVDTSSGRDAFVSLEAAPGYLVDAGDAMPGDRLRLQVKRAAEREKAARLTQRLQIEGRFLVLTPDAPGLNISKKITDEARREHLRALLEPFAQAAGLVVRTRATHADDAALTHDAQRLTGLAARETLRGPDAFERAALRWDADQIALADGVDNSQIDAIPHGMPILRDPDPFDRFDADAALSTLAAPCAALPNGASMMIERTEAAITVDINAGAASRDAAMLDAMTALPAALRLRALGGTIVIDPAGKPSHSTRRKLETGLTEAARTDGNLLKVLGWGPAGLLEATSPRPARGLAETLRRIEAP